MRRAPIPALPLGLGSVSDFDVEVIFRAASQLCRSVPDSIRNLVDPPGVCLQFRQFQDTQVEPAVGRSPDLGGELQFLSPFSLCSAYCSGARGALGAV